LRLKKIASVLLIELMPLSLIRMFRDPFVDFGALLLFVLAGDDDEAAVGLHLDAGGIDASLARLLHDAGERRRLAQLAQLGQAREILESVLAELPEELGQRTVFATVDAAVDLEVVILGKLGHAAPLHGVASIKRLAALERFRGRARSFKATAAAEATRI